MCFTKLHHFFTTEALDQTQAKLREVCRGYSGSWNIISVFSFPQSVSFHLCCTLIFYMLALTRRTIGWNLGALREAIIFRKSRFTGHKGCHPQPTVLPCDFLLFPKMKLKLKGRRFNTIEKMQVESQRVFDTPKEKDFHKAFQKYRRRWDRCLHAWRNNFEGEGCRQALRWVLRFLECQSEIFWMPPRTSHSVVQLIFGLEPTKFSKPKSVKASRNSTVIKRSVMHQSAAGPAVSSWGGLCALILWRVMVIIRTIRGPYCGKVTPLLCLHKQNQIYFTAIHKSQHFISMCVADALKPLGG